jgi:hypothetical protein
MPGKDVVAYCPDLLPGKSGNDFAAAGRTALDGVAQNPIGHGLCVEP